MATIYGIFEKEKFTGQIVGQYEKDQGENYLEFLKRIRNQEKPSVKEISQEWLAAFHKKEAYEDAVRDAARMF